MKTSTQCFHITGVAIVLALVSYFLPVTSPGDNRIVAAFVTAVTCFAFQPFAVWGTLSDANWRIRTSVSTLAAIGIAVSAMRQYWHVQVANSAYPFGQPTLWQSVLAWCASFGLTPLLTCAVLLVARHAGCKLSRHDQQVSAQSRQPQLSPETIWLAMTLSVVLVSFLAICIRSVSSAACDTDELIGVSAIFVAPFSLALTTALLRLLFGRGPLAKRTIRILALILALISIPLLLICCEGAEHDARNGFAMLSAILVYLCTQIGILALALLPFELTGYRIFWESAAPTMTQISHDSVGAPR